LFTGVLRQAGQEVLNLLKFLAQDLFTGVLRQAGQEVLNLLKYLFQDLGPKTTN
jgi:hypothetical protein